MTVQEVLDEIFINPLHEDNEENHLEKDYSDSSKYLPESDEEVTNEVIDSDTHNEPVRSTSKQSFGFHWPVVQDFVVGAAVFHAVLLFFFATF